MKTETKVLISIFIFSLVLILGAVFVLSKSTKTLDSNSFVNIDYSKGQKIGSDSAKVKFVEYSDLQCPACKMAEPYVKDIREKYKNDVQFIYKHFPLMQHVHAKEAARFAEFAATKGKFWEIHGKLFETQESWSTLPDIKDFFANLGAEFGLDKDLVKEAVSKDTYDQIINDSYAEGIKIGANSTPTFYVNNKKVVIKTYEDLDKAIQEGLQSK